MRKLPLDLRILDIVRQHAPISPRDLQRRCGVRPGTKNIQVMLFGPTLTGFSEEFCAAFCPLVCAGVLRLEQLRPGWKSGWRVVMGEARQNRYIA
ncbi:MAG TPA: winged helix-turn-helix domain-containing protein [Vicinamibacterales bacterium]|nr:winged helix-turn-helix domain-containing protein [Vicinamibacterales bacterium]